MRNLQTQQTSPNYFMESDVRFGMNSDDPEARSVAHEEFGEETEKDSANLFVLVVGGSGSFPHRTRRRGRGRKGDVSLHHVRVEYLLGSEGLMGLAGLMGSEGSVDNGRRF